MANQERLNLSNESNGLNRNLDIGSASATVQLINETKPNEVVTTTFSTSTNTGSKKKNCISSNTNDGSNVNTNANGSSNKHKINASNDQLKSSKTFEASKDETKEDIQMKNLKKSVTSAAQVKINLVDDEAANNKLKKEKEKSLSNLTTTHNSNNNRKKFFEISFSKINRKTLKRPLPCLFAWTLLIGTTGAYFAMVSPKLLELLEFNYFYWLSVIASQSIIFLYVLVNFLIATMRDPGRFPKVIISPDDPTFNDDTKSPLYKTVTIKKTQVKIKWCSVRNILLFLNSLIKCKSKQF